MKLEKGKNYIELTRPFYQIMSAGWVTEHGHVFTIQFSAMSSIRKLRNDDQYDGVKSKPLLYGFDDQTNRLEFFPPADQDYEIQVRYLPPPEEM